MVIGNFFTNFGTLVIFYPLLSAVLTYEVLVKMDLIFRLNSKLPYFVSLSLK